MKIRKRYLLISLLSVTATGFAQESYGVSSFESGLPTFPPVHRWVVADQQFVTIPLLDTLGALFVCRGETKEGRQAFVLVTRRSDESYTMSWLELNSQPDSSFRSTLDIHPFADRGTPFPLDIRVVGNQLFYRWVLSEDTSHPGGVPVAADVPLDRGKSFPTLRFSRLDGQLLESGEFKGKITVLNSWATWCTACVMEIPGFNKLVETYPTRVRFVAVAQNSPEELRRFLQRKNFAFEHMIADDQFIQLFGGGVPRTVILDQTGTIVFDQSGGSEDTYKHIAKAIEGLLKAK